MTELMDPVEYVRRHSEEMSPIPTGLTPSLPAIEGIEGVVFDIYGTLIQSAAGGIAPAGDRSRVEGMRRALEGLGVEHGDTEDWIRDYDRELALHQDRRAQAGCLVPEVEIREVWEEMISRRVGAAPDRGAIEDAVLRFECAANPTWEMPGASGMLARMRSRGIPCGVLSNAQFYTPAVVSAALGSWKGLGFDPDLSLFSWCEGEAKPSPRLFAELGSRLSARGIEPCRVLYVGNDMRKDVHPAKEAGFVAALFAGDGRSLRFDEGGEDGARESCDAILTEWAQLDEILK